MRRKQSCVKRTPHKKRKTIHLSLFKKKGCHNGPETKRYEQRRLAAPGG